MKAPAIVVTAAARTAGIIAAPGIDIGDPAACMPEDHGMPIPRGRATRWRERFRTLHGGAAAHCSPYAGVHASPSTAIGKDFPYDGRWFGVTPSGTGLRLNLGGYLGLRIGWAEGIEVNVLGAVWGIDVRHPALKLPAVGRIGV